MTLADEHAHEFPHLPDEAPPDRAGDRGLTCPSMLNDGTVCGEPMAFAHNVREFHTVLHWTPGGLLLGEANEFDAPDDEDPHLWCAAGHDWSVPERVELD